MNEELKKFIEAILAQELECRIRRAIWAEFTLSSPLMFTDTVALFVLDRLGGPDDALNGIRRIVREMIVMN